MLNRLLAQAAAALALVLSQAAIAAPAAADTPLTLGQYADTSWLVAGGNTGACKRSCDNALERCMSKNISNCQEVWKVCNQRCERNS